MTVDDTPADIRTPTLTGRLFTDDHFDFNARLALSKASQGTFDLGIAVRTLGRIVDGDPESWFREWTATADRLRRHALVSEHAGQQETSGWFYLGAAESYARSIDFIDGMADDSALLPAFRQYRACWESFIDSSCGRNVRCDTAFEDTTLPGYLFRPDASGRPRPTVVITNGSDGSLSGLWAEGLRASLERGWNVYVFEGPGQQSLLFEQGIPFRHDWESVLTPVVDTLLTRPDVDGERLLALAVSQGGYWLPRALAFEHRFLAAAVDDGVWDVSRVWDSSLPESLVALLDAGERNRFNEAVAATPIDPIRHRDFLFRARPYGSFETPYDLFQAVRRYRLAEVAGQIRTPILICDPDDETWFTGQPRALYDALTCEKELLHCSREDGAEYHCEPWARGLVNARICDFFRKHLELAASRAE